MGVRRIFRNLKWYIGKLRHQRILSSTAPLLYEGLAIPRQRTGMIEPILFQIYNKNYERPEMIGLARVIRSGDRILELGAGLGIITALAARAAGASGVVRAYEANAALIPDTLAFFASNKITTVDLVHAVLVPEENPAPRSFHLAGSFAESSLMGADGRNPEGMVDVPAECLADVLESFRPDVLICDIEGAEAELLSALPPSSLRAAVVEMHPDRLSVEQVQSIHDAMRAQGLYEEEPSPGGTVVVFQSRQAV